jgi:hypothetical protein
VTCLRSHSLGKCDICDPKADGGVGDNESIVFHSGSHFLVSRLPAPFSPGVGLTVVRAALVLVHRG